MTSVCPSVCGWYAVLMRKRVPLIRKISRQKELRNTGSLSKTMLRENPWCLQTKSRNRDATLKAEKFVGNAPRWTPFEYLSTMTRMTVNPWDGGMWVIKSIERSSQTPAGIGKGCSNPAGRRVLNLVCWHTLHSRTKRLTSCCRLVQ